MKTKKTNLPRYVVFDGTSFIDTRCQSKYSAEVNANMMLGKYDGLFGWFKKRLDILRFPAPKRCECDENAGDFLSRLNFKSPRRTQPCLDLTKISQTAKKTLESADINNGSNAPLRQPGALKNWDVSVSIELPCACEKRTQSSWTCKTASPSRSNSENTSGESAPISCTCERPAGFVFSKYADARAADIETLKRLGVDTQGRPCIEPTKIGRWQGTGRGIDAQAADERNLNILKRW